MKNKKYILILVLSISIINISNAQEFSDYIKDNAISYKKNTKLNSNIYNVLAPYNLIMIGELHGTKEPANFVKGLAKLFQKKGDTIIIGMEIPKDMMKLYLENKQIENIKKSAFFSNKDFDGRVNLEWLNLLKYLHRQNIRTFFFDISNEEWKNSAEKRDSLMFLNIKREMKKNPHYKIITLSGNIHNRLSPFHNKKTTAIYLNEDNFVNENFKVCTLNHKFAKGKMRNNTGNGVYTKELNNKKSVFSKNVDFYNYLLLINDYKYNYSGVFFTKKITPSKEIKN